LRSVAEIDRLLDELIAILQGAKLGTTRSPHVRLETGERKVE
jgi:hypothetical protein